MNQTSSMLGLGMVAALAVAGCTSPLQKEARAEWERVALEATEPTEGGPAPTAPAATTPTASDLADYLRIAALNNPGLKAAFERWKAAIERVPQVRALPDPKFTYGYFVQEVETRVGPQKHRVGVMQAFPWLSKLRLRGDVAAREARVHGHLYDAEKLRLFYQVRKVYHDYAYLGRSIAIVGESMDLLRNLEAVVRARYAAGAASHPNLIQTQVELGKLEDRLKSLQALQPALVAQLNAVLGRDITTPVPWPKGHPTDHPPLPVADLIAALAQENPERHAARERIRTAEAGADLAAKTGYPDFALGLTTIQTDSRNDMDVDDNGKDPVLLTLDVTLPIWRDKNRAAEREAAARLAAAKHTHANRTLNLSAELRVALYHYDDARRKVNLFRDTLVPKSEEGLKATQTAFAAGKGRFLDIIDAERTLLEFRLLTERALANQAIRLAELERLAGRELRQTVGRPPQ